MLNLTARRRQALALPLALLLSTGLATAAFAAPAAADPRDARIDQLERQVQALLASQARLEAEYRQAAVKPSQAAPIATIPVQPAKPAAAIATIAGGRPAIASADGQFSIAFHSVMQLDAAAYDQAGAGPVATDLRRSGPALGASASNVDLTHARDLKDGLNFRRARLGVDGTAFGDWNYRLTLDFGGTGVENTGQLYEAWTQYNPGPFKVRVGAFSAPIGLEDQGSTNSMPFLERPVSADLARGLAAGDTRMAAAVLASGPNWFASGAVTGRTIGVINTGTASATPQTYGDPLAVVGRFVVSPVHTGDARILVGVHGSYLARAANASGPGASGPAAITAYTVSLGNTAELRVDGTKLINTGAIDARTAGTAGLEFAAQKGPLLLQSEYERFTVGRTDSGMRSPSFGGYYVEGVWTLTGETRVYNAQTAAFDAVSPAHPFNLKAHTWGMWELGLRYSQLDLNYDAGSAGSAPLADAIRGGREQGVTAGLNWYPNSVVRFMLDYQHARIDRLSPSAALYQTPSGAQIGQSYNVLTARSQFAF
jgi:phosphate-selective porin OprO/OprP